MSNITVKIPDGLLRQLRHKCIDDGLRLQDAVGNAIFTWLHPREVDPVKKGDAECGAVLDANDTDVIIE
jgi:hypothetical protein